MGVVTNDEGTIVGLLGASPGASTCVTVALDTLEKCFGGNKPQLKKWAPKLKEMIPTWSAGAAAGDLKKVTAQEVEMLYKTTGDILKISPPFGKLNFDASYK